MRSQIRDWQDERPTRRQSERPTCRRDVASPARRAVSRTAIDVCQRGRPAAAQFHRLGRSGREVGRFADRPIQARDRLLAGTLFARAFAGDALTALPKPCGQSLGTFRRQGTFSDEGARASRQRLLRPLAYLLPISARGIGWHHRQQPCRTGGESTQRVRVGRSRQLRRCPIACHPCGAKLTLRRASRVGPACPVIRNAALRHVLE